MALGDGARCRVSPSLLLKRISAPSASPSPLATALTQAAVSSAPGTSETASVAPRCFFCPRGLVCIFQPKGTSKHCFSFQDCHSNDHKLGGLEQQKYIRRPEV